MVGANAMGDLYFLWSVERVGVIYGLTTIVTTDWYAWGAPLIVDHQSTDGSWSNGHGPLPDTCFALLFLKRVNVAKDLTKKLELLGPIEDVGMHPNKPENQGNLGQGTKPNIQGSGAEPNKPNNRQQ